MAFKVRLLVLAATMLVASNCTMEQHYTPNVKTFALEAIRLPKAQDAQTVLLENGEPEDHKTPFFKRGLGVFVADYHLWTDAAIRLMEQELEKKDYAVSADGSSADGLKTLKLNIIDAAGFSGAWRMAASVTLSVRTGEGKVGVFKTENSSPWDLGRAVDGALIFAVGEALNSKLVIEYLAGPDAWTKALSGSTEEQ